MFEDSLITSGVSLEQRRNVGRTRWIAMASIAIQGLVLGAFIAVPMIWPERLPLVSIAPKLALLTLKKPEVKVEPKPVRVETIVDNAMHAPALPQQFTESRGTSLIHSGPSNIQAAEVPDFRIGLGMGSPSPFGSGGPGPGSNPVVVAASAKPSSPLKISDGVTKGMLLAPIHPIYPRIAVISHIEGTVVVTATIDKQGRITGLQVLSGNPMLTSAAIDAIKDARYKPYLLNGEPTDIITTISVNFRFGQS